MATGWARDGAVQEQIDASVEDAVELARSRLPKGESLVNCEECGIDIPAARREAIAGVRLCIACQQELDQLRSDNAELQQQLQCREADYKQAVIEQSQLLKARDRLLERHRRATRRVYAGRAA